MTTADTSVDCHCRVGVCVAGLDPAALERGLACTPGSVPTFTRAVAVVEKIRFYKATVAVSGYVLVGDCIKTQWSCRPGGSWASSAVPTVAHNLLRIVRVRTSLSTTSPQSKSKMHVTIGHATAVADLHFFGLPDEAEPWWLTSKEAPAQDAGRLRKREYARPVQARAAGTCCSWCERAACWPLAAWLLMQVVPPPSKAILTQRYSRYSHISLQMESEEYLHQDELYGPEGRPGAEPTSSVQSDMPELGVTYRGPQWVLMQFEHPVTAPRDSVVIGSRVSGGSGNSASAIQNVHSATA